MTDNVIQSFCERCGARFTQPAPAERPAPPAGMLGRFRRRTPDSDGTPADDSALPVSDAFKDTFHFCLGCRRYNCPDCWNQQAGHCLSCRPLDGPAVDEPAVTVARTLTPATDAGSAADAPPVSEPTRWPTGDLAPRASVTTAGSDPVPTVDRSVWGAPVAGVSSTTSPPHVVSPPAEPAVHADPILAAASDLPWTPTAEIDPWRGVVFTAEEQGRSETVAAPEPIEDVGVLASLMDTETHVDASDWARASAAVMGGVGASVGAQSQDARPPTTDDVVEPAAEFPVAEAAPVEPVAEFPVAEAAPVEPAAEFPVAEAADDEPAAEFPVAEAADDEPVAEFPVAEAAPVEPVAEFPVAEAAPVEPVAEFPVAEAADDEPAAEFPVAEAAPVEPVAEFPVAEAAPVEPVAEFPVAEAAPVEPVAEFPVAEAAPVEPVAEFPVAEAAPVEPVAEFPVAEAAPVEPVAEFPVAEAADDEPMRPDDTPLAPVPETEAWLHIARRGLDDTTPDVADTGAPTALGVVALHAIDDEAQPAPDSPPAAEPPPAEADTSAAVPPQTPPSIPDAATPLEPPQVEPSTPTPPPLTPTPVAPALPAPPPVPPVPPRQVPPTVPSPGLEVWATPVDTGPFAQPYQPPPPQAVVVMPSMPPAGPAGAPPATVPTVMAAPPVAPA